MRSSNKKLTLQFVIALFFFSSVNLIAQNKVVREIAPFDKVKISDDLKVTFKKADRENITIVAKGIGYDKIVTESSGRELKLKVKTGIFKDTDVQILVEYVKLRSIEATNKADIKFEEILTGDELILKASSNAVINVEVQVSALKASLSNGGRIEISGTADLQEVEANLGSKYNAYEFETENGYIKSNTTSDVVVWVKNRLEASAGSKAKLKYRGKPEDVQSSSSLGGKISGDL
jgi:hypothetical protein